MAHRHIIQHHRHKIETTMPARRLRLGVGAKCSILINRIHPGNITAVAFPNYTRHDRLDDCVVIDRRPVTRGGKTFIGVFFAHPSLEGHDVYTAQRFAVVKSEGDPSEFFETEAAPAPDIDPDADAFQEEDDQDPATANPTNRAEDIALIRGQGFDVDDDNEPAPENIPDANAANEGLYETQSWGLDSHVDQMASNGFSKPPGFHHGFNPKTASYFDLFKVFFPWVWFSTVLLPMTNANAKTAISLGELIRYLGLWIRMSSVGGGFSKEDFWTPGAYDEENNPCPYNFRKYMSLKRFDQITAALMFTDRPKPTFVDRFWQVRQMIEEWNKNMADKFYAGWAICLDESMSIWHNRWTCPGWVFCPRKPHDKGNEYHSACCALSGIMFVIEMVEGKDKPAARGAPKYEAEYGKTGGLLLRMLESYFNTGRYVVLDSGFCVLMAIVGLFQKGLYAGALIKKRKYWPKYVPGQAMENWFGSKSVGDVGAITGILNGVKYYLWGMKEPDYVMRIMATGGMIVSDSTCKLATRGNGAGRVQFHYTKPFDWHFRYRHAVDDHNNKRHTLPSIEDTWKTLTWEIRVFAFILAITEVNVYLAKVFFVWSNEERDTYLQFRRKFSFQLINNPYMPANYGASADGEDALDVACSIETAPAHAREYRNRTWVCDAKLRYQQYLCKEVGCKNRVRTYCACMIGHWMCPNHVLKHAVSKVTTGN